jgi:pimeloyl-ACP methyl ester carboxylesterase
LETLETLAVDRPIVFYDQLGRGKSDRPDDPSRWRIDRFVAEVGAVRRGLGLEKVHVLGHSWGGWLMQFMQRHLCRLDPWPDALERSGRNIEGTPVYEAMFGPNEFTVTGNLKEWDRTDRLHEIAVPTLITCGRSEGLVRAVRQPCRGASRGAGCRSLNTARTWRTWRNLRSTRGSSESSSDL